LLAAAEAVPGAAVPAAQETTDDLVGIEGAEAAAVAPETQSVPAAAALPVAATMPVAAPVLGGGLAAAPAVAQPRSTRPRPDDGQRVGTWRSEERQYVTEVILRFGEGRLPNVPDNTSLRVLLSNVLNCSPMRITKKFSGRNALPRGRYRRTVEPEAAVVERLRTLERAFHRRVRDDGTVLTITLCGTYDLPTVKAIADAAAAAASAARVAAGGAVGRRSPTAKRARSRSRTASPADLRAPLASFGAPSFAGPYTAGTTFAAGPDGPPPPPVPVGEPAKISIAIAGLLDLTPAQPTMPARVVAGAPVVAAAPAPTAPTAAPPALVMNVSASSLDASASSNTDSTSAPAPAAGQNFSL